VVFDHPNISPPRGVVRGLTASFEFIAFESSERILRTKPGWPDDELDHGSSSKLLPSRAALCILKLDMAVCILVDGQNMHHYINSQAVILITPHYLHTSLKW
jgi:hypothetical protein